MQLVLDLPRGAGARYDPELRVLHMAEQSTYEQIDAAVAHHQQQHGESRLIEVRLLVPLRSEYVRNIVEF